MWFLIMHKGIRPFIEVFSGKEVVFAKLNQLFIGMLRLISLLLWTFGQVAAIFLHFSVKFIENAYFALALLQPSSELLCPP